MAACFYRAARMRRHYDYQHDDMNDATRDSVEILKYYKYRNESVATKSKFSNIYRVRRFMPLIINVLLIDVERNAFARAKFALSLQMIAIKTYDNYVFLSQ